MWLLLLESNSFEIMICCLQTQSVTLLTCLAFIRKSTGKIADFKYMQRHHIDLLFLKHVSYCSDGLNSISQVYKSRRFLAIGIWLCVCLPKIVKDCCWQLSVLCKYFVAMIYHSEHLLILAYRQNLSDFHTIVLPRDCTGSSRKI
jgi:hypothetical protein